MNVGLLSSSTQFQGQKTNVLQKLLRKITSAEVTLTQNQCERILYKASKIQLASIIMLFFFLFFLCHLIVKIGDSNGTQLQYSCQENPMDGGTWQAAIHGVTKSRTRLSDFIFTFPFHALEMEMGTHSSVLAWRIPGMGEPGGLPSMGSHRIRHD